MFPERRTAHRYAVCMCSRLLSSAILTSKHAYSHPPRESCPSTPYRSQCRAPLLYRCAASRAAACLYFSLYNMDRYMDRVRRRPLLARLLRIFWAPSVRVRMCGRDLTAFVTTVRPKPPPDSALATGRQQRMWNMALGSWQRRPLEIHRYDSSLRVRPSRALSYVKHRDGLANREEARAQSERVLNEALDTSTAHQRAASLRCCIMAIAVLARLILHWRTDPYRG